MAELPEDDKLRHEIHFLTALIQKHKEAETPHSRRVSNGKLLESSEGCKTISSSNCDNLTTKASNVQEFTGSDVDISAQQHMKISAGNLGNVNHSKSRMTVHNARWHRRRLTTQVDQLKSNKYKWVADVALKTSVDNKEFCCNGPKTSVSLQNKLRVSSPKTSSTLHPYLCADQSIKSTITNIKPKEINTFEIPANGLQPIEPLFHQSPVKPFKTKGKYHVFNTNPVNAITHPAKCETSYSKSKNVLVSVPHKGVSNVNSQSPSSLATRYKVDRRKGIPLTSTACNMQICSMQNHTKKMPCQNAQKLSSHDTSTKLTPNKTPNLVKANTGPHKKIISKYKLVKTSTSTSVTPKRQDSFLKNKNRFKLIRHPLPHISSPCEVRKLHLFSNKTNFSSLSRYKLVKTTGTSSTPTLVSGYKLLQKAKGIAYRKRRSFETTHGQKVYNDNPKNNLHTKNKNMKKTWTKRYSLKRSHSCTESLLDVNHLLGRIVSNKSKNKYKFIKGDFSKTRSNRFVYHAHKRKQAMKYLPTKQSNGRWHHEQTKVANHQRRNSFSSHYSSTGKGKGRYGKYQLVNHVTTSSSTTQIAASLAVKRSLHAASTALSRKQSKHGSQQLCLFFCRFGKCNRGEKCPYKHDPEKVAVCTRFIRGTCKGLDCPFSHKVSEDKMPVCSFFLKGICSRDSCPYRHVNVGRDAEPCLEFARGHCQLSEKCTKKHVLFCPEHDKNEKCPRGKKCPLRHRKLHPRCIKRKQSRSSSAGPEVMSHSKARSHKQEKKIVITASDGDDSSIPKSDVLPAFIALNNDVEGLDDKAAITTKATTSLAATKSAHILPKFLRKS